LSDGDAIGDLAAGSVTLLSSAQAANVRIASGELISLKAGETASAGSARAARDHRDKTTGKCIDDDNDGKEECTEGLPLWAWYVIAGGIAGGVIIALAVGGDDDDTDASPVR
jgi:hypothetical protein